jgi:hypothetical protein
VKIGPLYHWSPADRHDRILREGLLPGQIPSTATRTQKRLCFGLDPAAAWKLSGGLAWTKHIPEWDLWMVKRLRSDVSVFVQPFWGGEAVEVQTGHRIRPVDLWHVGRRTR